MTSGRIEKQVAVFLVYRNEEATTTECSFQGEGTTGHWAPANMQRYPDTFICTSQLIERERKKRGKRSKPPSTAPCCRTNSVANKKSAAQECLRIAGIKIKALRCTGNCFIFLEP